MIKESFIYNGQVIHKRFKPKQHFFKYNVFLRSAIMLIALAYLKSYLGSLAIFSQILIIS